MIEVGVGEEVVIIIVIARMIVGEDTHAMMITRATVEEEVVVEEEGVVIVVDASRVTGVTEIARVIGVEGAEGVAMDQTSEYVWMTAMRGVKNQVLTTMIPMIMDMVEVTMMDTIVTEEVAFVVAVVAVEEEEVASKVRGEEKKQLRAARRRVVVTMLLLQEVVIAPPQKLHRTIRHHWCRRTLGTAIRTVAEVFEEEVEVSVVEVVVDLELIQRMSRSKRPSPPKPGSGLRTMNKVATLEAKEVPPRVKLSMHR